MGESSGGPARPSILIVGGPTATIENTPPLLTTNGSGAGGAGGGLRAQRLAAEVDVLIEAYSGHPLEKDAAHLYGRPDCYVDSSGRSVPEGTPGSVPAYRARLRPDDGLFLLPYVAVRSDGAAWDVATASRAVDGAYRQTFYPSPDRLIEEIDRFGVDGRGTNMVVSEAADITTIRLAPPGGYLSPSQGEYGDEIAGKDFFPYQPTEFAGPPGARTLAKITNVLQSHLRSGGFDGVIWLEGSPFIEETTYWLNLLLDTTVPVCGNASQRPHGAISNDGDRNLVDSVRYIASREWEDTEGRDRVGVVLVQDQRIYAAREAHKVAARPGGYRAGGGTGGVIGAVAGETRAILEYLPTRRHTYQSSLTLPSLPETVLGSHAEVDSEADSVESVMVRTKDQHGNLLENAIPCVKFVKVGRYAECSSSAESIEVEIEARIVENLKNFPLAGFVLEGSTPFGHAYPSINRSLARALYCGMPTVRVGRGDPEDYVPEDGHLDGLSVPGANLAAPKARILLMACLLKFGAAPVAVDPRKPTEVERRSTRQYLDQLTEIFETH